MQYAFCIFLLNKKKLQSYPCLSVCLKTLSQTYFLLSTILQSIRPFFDKFIINSFSKNYKCFLFANAKNEVFCAKKHKIVSTKFKIGGHLVDTWAFFAFFWRIFRVLKGVKKCRIIRHFQGFVLCRRKGLPQCKFIYIL